VVIRQEGSEVDWLKFPRWRLVGGCGLILSVIGLIVAFYNLIVLSGAILGLAAGENAGLPTPNNVPLYFFGASFVCLALSMWLRHQEKLASSKGGSVGNTQKEAEKE
jgi:uncharacterized membrane protein